MEPVLEIRIWPAFLVMAVLLLLLVEAKALLSFFAKLMGFALHSGSLKMFGGLHQVLSLFVEIALAVAFILFPVMPFFFMGHAEYMPSRIAFLRQAGAVMLLIPLLWSVATLWFTRFREADLLSVTLQIGSGIAVLVCLLIYFVRAVSISYPIAG